ncbi:MAG: hypothetical protein ABI855_12240 [Bacteroidota bacterium]
MKNLTEIQTQNRMINDLLIFIFHPDNALILNTVPSFKEASVLLRSQSGNVSDLFSQYVKLLKGIAEKRRESRLSLAGESFVFMQACRAWFISQENLDAAGQMDISLSILERKGYTKLGQIIASVQTTIEPEISNLAPYNITPASFLLWQNSLAAYMALKSAHAGVAARKAIGNQINTAMKATMKTLKTQCDTTVHSIQNENFVSTYFTNRRLVREGIHHTGAHVQVQNEMGEPFGPQISVTVNSFTKNDRTYKAVTALTGDSSAADVSVFEPGERTITISGHGIITKTFGPYIFHKSKILNLVLIAQPQFENLPQSQDQPQNQQANNQ